MKIILFSEKLQIMKFQIKNLAFFIVLVTRSGGRVCKKRIGVKTGKKRNAIFYQVSSKVLIERKDVRYVSSAVNSL